MKSACTKHLWALEKQSADQGAYINMIHFCPFSDITLHFFGSWDRPDSSHFQKS